MNKLGLRAFKLLSCALLCIASAAPSAWATDALYENDQLLQYPGTVSSPPMIDATNFVNNSTFQITFGIFFPSIEFFETWNTINHTNNGIMSVDTGFRFDTQTADESTPHKMSGSFYNGGDIQIGSFFGLGGFLGDAKLIVNSTNITSPGSMEIGPDGLMRLTGHTIDLSRGTFTMEIFSTGAAGSGVFGVNTNAWNPAANLQADRAVSAQFPINPFQLVLFPSASYFNIVSPDGTNNIFRSAFVQDASPTNVTYKVYFGTGDLGLGGGNLTIEWIGSYQDSATGQSATNYLYLNDNYELGASTNVQLLNGFPNNFTVTQSSFELIPANRLPTPSSFDSIFPDVAITNRYSFANIQLISTDISTNASATNPSGALTNLPGRMEIAAAQDLDLSYSTISGQNFLAIQSTNQFKGSAGAQIISPFSDINVGVTNGFLTISNLAQSTIPNWRGTIQAWNTRFLDLVSTTNINVTETNGVFTTNTVTFTVTNDFRVVLVRSEVEPVTPAYVQDLILHGTNSVVISDAFTVLRKLSIDAENLTLTTNGPGVGATSLDGELNLLSSGIFFQSSLPNLRNLTNSGAIRTMNLAQFYGSSTTVTSVPSVAAVPASGTLSESAGSNVAANDTVTIGAKTYKFVKTLSNLKQNQVKKGATFDASLNNLIAAINHGPGSGKKYSSKTTGNAQVSAGVLSNHQFTVTARVAGTAGNSVVTTTTSTRLTWSNPTLFGGADAVIGFTNSSTANIPYFNFINNGLLSDQGSIIMANYFESGGIITNGSGSFNLKSQNVVLTNGALYAGGDVSITANTLVASNLALVSGRSLTLQITNLLTDTGVTNGNNWALNSGNINGGNGLIVPIKPPAGDLLGTTIEMSVPGPAKNLLNIWPGQDRGISTDGYTNNLAIGRLILSSTGSSSTFTFTGAGGVGVTNAMYVDSLELVGQAANTDIGNNASELNISPNIIIYYARALANGVDASAKLNHKNGDHLRWVPQYIGQFSGVQIIYPDGSTNTFNAGLAVSTTADSDGDGIANASDPTPFFTTGQINLQTLGTTNIPPLSVILQWNSIPGSTNILFYSTNMVGPFDQVVTQFVSPSIVPPIGGWPITNIVYDPVVSPGRFYNVIVIPNSTLFYGP